MAMGRIRGFIRFSALFGILTVVFGVPGILFFKYQGALAALGAAYLVLAWAAIRSERALIRKMRAIEPPSQGLLNSFEMVLNELRREAPGAGELLAPRLLVFSDPVPKVLSVRALTGNGSVLLSSGLLGQFNEPELRMILRVSYLRLQQADWVFYSLCSYLLIWVLWWMPGQWAEILFSTRPTASLPLAPNQKPRRKTPLSAVRVVLLLPWIRLLLRLGNPGPFRIDLGSTWDTALHKIRSRSRDAGNLNCPGASMLVLGNWLEDDRARPFFLPFT